LASARPQPGFAEIHLAAFPQQPFLIAESDDVIRPYVQRTGAWEPGLWAFVASLLPPQARVVIGGAHVGLSAFQLWRARPDVAEILACEADAVNAGLLALNVRSWGTSPVRVLPIALGRRLERAALVRHPRNTGDHRLWSDEEGAAFERTDIVAASLDELWRGPLDLLLLDTQGWEPDVLAGATRVVLEQRPTIVLEWWPHALKARGLEPEEILRWLERDLRLRVDVVPAAASGVNELMPSEAGSLGDVRELTELLLAQQDRLSAYAELVLRPRERDYMSARTHTTARAAAA